MAAEPATMAVADGTSLVVALAVAAMPREWHLL
jgi:hypothetical protein